MQAAILAGGLATRLGDLARDKPKSLVMVDGRPFLDYQLELLKKNGFTEVVLCIGHLKDQIIRHCGDGSAYGLKLAYSCEDQPLGTAGALRNAAPLLGDVFFTLYGDSYLEMDYQAVMRYFLSNERLGLMTVYRNDDRYDRSNASVAAGLVTGYSKDARTPEMVYIDYGASILRKKALDLVPAHSASDLSGLFTRLIKKRELLAYEVSQRFYEIGSLQGISEFRKHVASKSSGAVR